MNSKIVHTASQVLTAGIFSTAFLSCDESLPSRVTPQNPVLVTVGLTSVHSPAQTVSSSQGDSVVSIRSLHIDILFTNNYSEVLQDSVDIQGTLEIWDADHPDRMATMDLQGASIFPSPSYPGRQLTLLPGGSADVTVSWNQFVYSPSTKDTIPVFQGVPTTTVMMYNAHLGTYIPVQVTNAPVRVMTRARIRVFVTTGFVESASVEQDEYYDIWPPGSS